MVEDRQTQVNPRASVGKRGFLSLPVEKLINSVYLKLLGDIQEAAPSAKTLVSRKAEPTGRGGGESLDDLVEHPDPGPREGHALLNFQLSEPIHTFVPQQSELGFLPFATLRSPN